MTRNYPYLTHPFVLFALLLTFANDHFFKTQFSNLLTGKISDFSGLFYFPFFLYGVFAFLRHPAKTHDHLGRRHFIAAIVFTDLLFVILKFTPLRQIFANAFSSYFFNIQIVPDTTDLLALSMNVLTYRLGRRFFPVTG